MTNSKPTQIARGPLRRNPTNPRYFQDDTGRPVYLTGAHTWASLVEMKLEGDPDFDYSGWLDMVAGYGHTFMRLWTWDHPKVGPWTPDMVYFDPMPHARTGPGLAWDGKPRFDLGRFNDEYFDRLRTRVIQAGERGIYLAVMFYEGWCVKWSYPGNDAWLSHPYNISNNINGVNGDPDGDGKADVYSLDVPEVVEYQKRYMRKVIDTVNDLDNVMFEIINEIPNDDRGILWQYHMIDFVHEYERGKPKQHPVGMTSEGGGRDNPVLFSSPADWISPGAGANLEYRYNPPANDGRKVVLSDTDHLWGAGGNYRWAWKSFLRGLNPLFMDYGGPLPGAMLPGYCGYGLNTMDYPDYEPLRRNLGYTRRIADRFDMNRLVPRGDLVSTGYCLAEPGTAYVAYVPDDPAVDLDLRGVKGTLAVEWLDPRTGATRQVDAVQGGHRTKLVSPFGSDSVVIVWAV